MNESELKNLKIYYTCEPSTESGQYGDNKPRKPYAVKAHYSANRDIWEFYVFSSETGELDFDTNACVIPTTHPKTKEISGIFETLKEAQEYYEKSAREYACQLVNEANEILSELEKE